MRWSEAVASSGSLVEVIRARSLGLIYNWRRQELIDASQMLRVPLAAKRGLLELAGTAELKIKAAV